MYRIFVIGIFMLAYYFKSGENKDLYNFAVSRVICDEHDPKLVYNLSCATHTISRNIKAHDILIITQPNSTLNNIFVRVDYLQRIGTTYRRSVISMEENFCGFLAGTSKSYLIKILWPLLQKTSNLPDKCPYHGPFNISGLVFEDSFLPPALPEGQARIDIHVRNGPKRLSLIKVKFYIEVKPKGAVKLDF